MTDRQTVITGLNAWRRRPFDYGRVDCCQFISHMIEHITGKNHASRFEYESEAEAYSLIGQHGTLRDFLIDTLGPTSDDLQDGDPVVCRLPVVGEFAGIKLDNIVVCLTEKGMVKVPESNIICGWSLCPQ